MNFLITGAAGFLGSALANQLAREDIKSAGSTISLQGTLSHSDPTSISRAAT